MATVRRLFVAPAPESPVGTRHPLEADEQHYARTVLRMQPGDAVMLADGAGREAEATLQAQGRALEVVQAGPWSQAAGLAHSAPLHLGCPLPKGERADWLAEKIAELGVTSWTVLSCARSVVVPHAGGKQARLVRLMRAAARQARHGRVPELRGPMPLQDWLELASPGLRVVADAGGSSAQARLQGLPATEARTLLIGPEGGLDPDELRAAEARGYGRLDLGPHILRVETAAIAGAVLLAQAR